VLKFFVYEVNVVNPTSIFVYCVRMWAENQECQPCVFVCRVGTYVWLP